MNFTQCAAYFAKRKDKTRMWRRYSHNQWIGYDHITGVYLHKHHHTVTVEIHPDDTYKLFIGGWDTVTTWAKMREFVNLPWIKPPPKAEEKHFLLTVLGKRTPFYDGIHVTRGGVVISEPRPWSERQLKENVAGEFAQLRKRVIGKLPKFAPDNLEMQMLFAFGNVYTWRMDGRELNNLMWEIDDNELSHASLLYVPRPTCVFGHERVANPNQSPQKLLETSIAAARRACYSDWTNRYSVEVKDE